MDVILPSESLERFLSEVRARRSTLNAGFSRPLTVDSAMSLREWNVQGRILKNTGQVTIDVRFDEQGMEPFPLKPGRRVRRTFTRLYLTYARDAATEPDLSGSLRSFSEIDEESDGQTGGSAEGGGVAVGTAGTNPTVGVASGLALAANAARKLVYFKNTSTLGQAITLGFDGLAAVLNFGVTLDVGEGFTMSRATWISTGAINAISSAAGGKLSIQEFV